MPDFGIGEGLAALFSGGLEGLFGGGAEAALGAGGASAFEGLGPAASAITVNALPGAAEAAGAAGFGGGWGSGLGELLGAGAAGLGAGATALASGAGSALGPSQAWGGEAIPGNQPSVPGGAEAPIGGAPAAPGGPGTGPVDIGSLLSQGGIPGAGGGPGAGGFAPAPGIQIPGGISPDPTSAQAFQPTNDTFATRAGAVTEAVNTGAFDPQGSNFTNFSGTPAGSNANFGAGQTPTASPMLGDFTGASASAAPPTGAQVPNTNPFTSSGLPNYAAYPEAGAVSLPNDGASGGGAFDKLLGGASDSIIKNPLGAALSAGGLGYSVLQGQKASKAVQALQQQAGKQGALADQLASYTTSGTLPPGSQAGVDQAIASAKANAVANAASQGLPTNPTQNTALAATLAKIDQQGPIVAAQIAQQLLTSGASYAGLSNSLYTQLAQIDMQQSQSMGKAIANMAAALNSNQVRKAA